MKREDGPTFFLHGGQKGDDVVLGGFFQLQDAVKLKSALSRMMSISAAGMTPMACQALADGQFHFEPDPEFCSRVRSRPFPCVCSDQSWWCVWIRGARGPSKSEGWRLVFRIKGKKKAAEAAFVQDAVVAVSEEDGVDVSLLPLPPDALQYPEAYQPRLSTRGDMDMTRWAVPRRRDRFCPDPGNPSAIPQRSDGSPRSNTRKSA